MKDIVDLIWIRICQIIAGHGEPAERLCNKDPFTMKSAEYLAHIFPNSKFLMMVRDGRATVHSIISRKVTITGFDLSNPRQCLEKWNHAVSLMYEVITLISSGLYGRGRKVGGKSSKVAKQCIAS